MEETRRGKMLPYCTQSCTYNIVTKRWNVAMKLGERMKQLCLLAWINKELRANVTRPWANKRWVVIVENRHASSTAIYVTNVGSHAHTNQLWMGDHCIDANGVFFKKVHAEPKSDILYNRSCCGAGHVQYVVRNLSTRTWKERPNTSVMPTNHNLRKQSRKR